MKVAVLLLTSAAVLAAREYPLFFYQRGETIQARTPRMSAEFRAGRIRLNGGITLRFLDSEARPAPAGRMRAKANFLLGDDESHWRRGVDLYERVSYRNLYPGIDAIYGGSERRLKSDFIVAPGAFPSSIRMAYTGAQSVRVDGGGSLIVAAADGEFREAPPIAWQEIDGRKVDVAVAFRVSHVGIVSFAVGAYDRNHTLFIDPVVTYSSFLGGNRIDTLTGVTADGAGNAYVCGYTDSIDMPLASSYDNSNNGGVDAFVAKFSPTGTLRYATYLGGNGDDRALAITVDIWGNAHLTGWTGSTNFPKQIPLQTALSGTRDAFVTKLDVNGTGLLYSTYFGGTGSDSGTAIGIDPWENTYIAGETASADLPTAGLYGPAQGQNRGGIDGFVTKFSIIGTLLFSTYLGGAGTDRPAALYVLNDTPYVTGSTTSVNFPVQGAFRSTSAGGQDAFVTRVSLFGNVFWYSTYLGGSAGATGFPESGYAIAVDATGIYVAGVTGSADFPLTTPFQSVFGGGGRTALCANSPRREPA